MLSFPGKIEVVLPSSVAGLLNPGDRNNGALDKKMKYSYLLYSKIISNAVDLWSVTK